MGANNGGAKIQFTSDHDNLLTVHYCNKNLERPTLELIATKLAKIMEKNVFKKIKNEYRFEQHGPFNLSISYGCLYVEKMDSDPDKLTALHSRVEESTVSFEFIAGASDKLNIRPVSSCLFLSNILFLPLYAFSEILLQRAKRILFMNFGAICQIHTLKY